MGSGANYRGLVVALAFGMYLAFSLVHLTLPGLQGDEALFAPAALGAHDPIEWQARIAGRDVPAMLMPYLGALKAHLYAPIFRVFGGGPVTVRLPVVLVGLISLSCTYLLVRSAFGEKAGTIALLLFASDPSFVFANKLDWGPVSLMMAFKMAALWFTWRWLRGSGSWYLAAAGFVLGLGMWDKVIFAWFIAAFLAALLAGFRDEVADRLTKRSLVVAATAFLLGAAPLLAYNIAVPLGTFRRAPDAVRTAIGSDVRYRAGLFRSTLDGSAVLGMINREEPESLAPKLIRNTGTPLDRAAGWVLRVRPLCRTPGFWVAVLSGGAAILLLRRARTFRKQLLFFLTLLLVTALLVCLTPAATGPHHVVFLLPFTHVLTAFVLSQIPSRRLFRTLIPAVTTGVLACANVVVDLAYLKSFEVTGGAGNWSDAIYELDGFVRAQPDRPLFLMDWGFRNQLLALSAGTTRCREVYLGNYPAEQRVEAMYPYLFPPSAMMVFHMPRYETNPSFRVFQEALMRYGLDARALRVFLQRDGHPVYAACATVRPELESHTRQGKYFEYVEAEDSADKAGGAVEFKPGASAGRMLGAGWGRTPSEYASFRFRLPSQRPEVHLYARYSFYSAGGRTCTVLLDGKPAADLILPYKGGAEGMPEHWEWADTGLGMLQPGEHIVTLRPTGQGHGINLDSLYLSEGPLQLNAIVPREVPEPASPPLNLEVLGYQDRPDARLEVNTHEILRGRDTLTLKLVNLRIRTIDLQYTLDGKPMPLIYGWRLDGNFGVSVAVDRNTKPGLYRYTAVKDSQDPSPASWIRVDVPILVK